MGVEEKLRGFLSKSAEVSKNVFSKAGDAVQEFSDKSVLKIDKMKLENQKTKKMADLGDLVYTLLQDENTTITLNTDKVKDLISEINKIESEIAEKTELLENFGDSAEDSKIEDKE